MNEVKSVTVQLRSPSEDDPGQVTQGFYTLKDGYLQMTLRDGRPLENPLFRVKLDEGVDHRAVAANLARVVRFELLGITNEQEAFNRPLTYGGSVA